MRKVPHIKYFIFTALMAVLIAGGGFNALGTNDGIQSSKEKISSEKQKLARVKQQKKELEEKLKELGELKGNVAENIAELDRELLEIRAESEGLKAEAEQTGDLVRASEKELETAIQNQNGQYSSARLRIKSMYEKGGRHALDMLVTSNSLSELLNRSEYISRVSEYDRKKLREFGESIKETELRMEELAERKELLEAQITALSERENAVALLQKEKQEELSAYDKRIAEANAGINEVKGDIRSIQAAIQAEENNIAAIEAEIRRREEAEKLAALERGEKYEPLTLNNISFTWPCPGADRITSRFGDREAPVKGASTSHKGIDIGAASGSAVKAAAGGTVVISTYSASAGNYIMISHGAGVYTVYMHLSSLGKSSGDSVVRGDTIGKVGSTGYSTGPHLHFGIRIDGSYVDPLAYVVP